MEYSYVHGGELCRPFSEMTGVYTRTYSLLLQRRITDFGAEKAFGRAAKQLYEHYGLTIPESSIRLITESHGEQLMNFNQAKTSKEEVEQVIAETDGSMVPIVEVDEQTTGDKRKTRQVCWKEAKLSLAYANGSVNPAYGATMGGVDKAGDQLSECAQRVGLTKHTSIHGIGDGATWIVNQMDRVFGTQASYLVDFGHLCDYLSKASKHCHADEKKWYQIQKDQMKKGEHKQVLLTLKPFLEPASVDDDNAPVRACHRYIQNRPTQFDYLGAEAAGLPIGSGRVESAHRYVIQQRLKLSGAWWKVDNAEKMLALRTTRENGDWQAYWDSRKAA